MFFSLERKITPEAFPHLTRHGVNATFFDIKIMYNLFMFRKNQIITNGLDILKCR